MKALQVITSDKKIDNPEVKDVQSIFDLKEMFPRAKKIDPNTYEVKGQVLKFYKNTGKVIPNSKKMDNVKLVNKGGRPKMDVMAVRNGVINTSWETLQKVLKDPKYDDKAKVMIALRLAEKTIPQQVDITSGGNPLILPAHIIDKNGI